MLRIVIIAAILAVAMVLVALIDVALTDRSRIAVLPKWGWLAVVVLLPVIGAVLWWYAGHPRATTSSAAPTIEEPAGATGIEQMTPEQRIAWLEHELAELDEEEHDDRGGSSEPKAGA
ncbi:PLD nuclease N-terminal domain-containing protein [Pseudoclavibacter soli]|uniref:PLD nuclease N-terminal domain-containing protein n=1 Tax=Pseudoclavibacter soli TaxID=452623 RepID=UPI0003FDEB59|nr:PLD nuclease N-terminal domain-containing protein [Pseudoclavibacter soli]